MSPRLNFCNHVAQISQSAIPGQTPQTHRSENLCYIASSPTFDIPKPLTHHSSMKINLPPAQEHFIQQQISSGAYPSPDAIISEAVQLLQQQADWKNDAATKIDQGWNEAKTGLLVSEDTLIRNLAARKAAWKSDKN